MEPVVDILVEVSICRGDDDVDVSMKVTTVASKRVVGISTDVKDSIELVIDLKTVGEIVDSSDSTVGLVMNVDILYSVVEISGKIDVLISLSSVDDNSSSNTSEVVVITLRELVNVDVIV
jgi:hypothetical protein